DPCRSFPGQCAVHPGAAARADRLLFRLYGHSGLRPRHLPQCLVLRARPRLQRDQGAGHAGGLSCRPPAAAGRDCRFAASGARRGHAVPADASRRLAVGSDRRYGAAEASARILAQAALPSGGRIRRRIWVAAVSARVAIWTDGACSGNPGPGGWGALLKFNGTVKELSGGEAMTTNNRMELTAAIRALEALTRSCAVDLYTDSQYVRGGITQWMKGWKRNGWKTADRKPVKNQELWEELDALIARHDVAWHWVKGHAGDVDNERADELARTGMAPFKGRS